jgi:hypothetical protein
MDEKLGVANRLMRKISMQLTWGKLALFGVVLVLILGIVGILVLKFAF